MPKLIREDDVIRFVLSEQATNFSGKNVTCGICLRESLSSPYIMGESSTIVHTFHIRIINADSRPPATPRAGHVHRLPLLRAIVLPNNVINAIVVLQRYGLLGSDKYIISVSRKKLKT